MTDEDRGAEEAQRISSQPLVVLGYTDQVEKNVTRVNENKKLEEKVLRVLDELKKDHVGVDQRWLNIGRTHIEQAFMAINRAIFKPTRLEGDI